MSYTNTIIATPLYSIDFLEGSKLSKDEQTSLLRVHLNHTNGGNLHYNFMSKIKKILQTDFNIIMKKSTEGSYVYRFGDGSTHHPTHYISNNCNVYRINTPIPIRNLFLQIEKEILTCENKISMDGENNSPQNIDAFTFLFQSFQPINKNEDVYATVIQKYARGMMARKNTKKMRAIITISSVMKRRIVQEKAKVAVSPSLNSKNDGMIYKVIPKIHRRKTTPTPTLTSTDMMNIDKDYTKDRFDYTEMEREFSDTFNLGEHIMGEINSSIDCCDDDDYDHY